MIQALSNLKIYEKIRFGKSEDYIAFSVCHNGLSHVMCVPALASPVSISNSMLRSARWLHIAFCSPAIAAQFSFADNALEWYSVDKESNFS